MNCIYENGALTCYNDDGSVVPADDPTAMEVMRNLHYVAPQNTPRPQRKQLDPTEIYERRLACNSCDQFNSSTDRCRACGCGDHMGRRVQSPYATCPLKRWPLHLPANP